jgi:hypothetical protein
MKGVFGFFPRLQFSVELFLAHKLANIGLKSTRVGSGELACQKNGN